MSGPWLRPCGDAAVLVAWEARLDPALNAHAQALAGLLAARPWAGLGEAVPGYCTLLVHYDPAQLTYAEVAEHVRAVLIESAALEAPPGRLVEIPVRYGGEAGPDLEAVAEHAGLSPAEVVRAHAGREYRVYLMGFTPGFAYLGELDERIAMPRLAAPRLRVPAGSVGIAGRQTGLYPLESPGGWRVIGRTAVTVFDPAAAAPFLLAPGDRVRFVPEA